MSKRNRREHGRILSVETMQRGSALDADAAVGATSITVTDAGDFDEDGGWLYIGAQVIEYSECDDDTGVITLATALAAAGEQGDPVAVYDPLYGEVVDYQEAHVQLDGEYDNLDVVVAEVAEGVGDLPEGDRGKAGESCTLLRVADDEWEIVGVGGRPRKSRGVRWEQDDFYTLTADDITAGTMTMPLTHRPADEALTCVLAGVPQRPTEWTINYDAQTLTIPLGGWEEAGYVAWVHYAYRKGVNTATSSDTSGGYVAGIMARSPVGYYRLGEPSGTTMTDSSGLGNHGTYSGSPTLGMAGLVPSITDSTAVEFVNGSAAGQVSVTDHPALKAGRVTIEATIDATATEAIAGNIAGRYDESSIGNSAWRLLRSGQDLTFVVCNGGTKQAVTAANAAPPANDPLLVGATYDGTIVKLFVNGAKVAESSPALPMQLGTRDFRIGSMYGLNYDVFKGTIDEVSLCDYACSEAEMAASYVRWVG